MYKQPRGSSFFGVLITFALGGLIGLAVACLAGWICDLGGGGGGGGGTVQLQPNQCTSAPNACGLVSIGTLSGGGAGSDGGGGVCDAVPPDNSQCPAPVIPSGTGFTAKPSTVGTNGTTMLSWESSNTTSCSVKGDNGFTASGGSSGSVTTAPMTQTTTFTLTCIDGEGGPSASASIRVIVNPQYKEI